MIEFQLLETVDAYTFSKVEIEPFEIRQVIDQFQIGVRSFPTVLDANLFEAGGNRAEFF